MNKKLITIILSMVLFVVTVLPVYGEDSKTGKFFLKNIVINGAEISNYNLSNPFVLYDDTTYMPMTTEIGEICGFKAEYNSDNKILKLYNAPVFKGNLSEQQPQSNGEDLTVAAILDVTTQAIITRNAQTCTVSALDLSLKPVIVVDGVPYLPLRVLAGESGLGWDLYYDPYYGICLSTINNVPAKEYFPQDLAAGNEKMQSYILSKNSTIRPTLALDYVFIFQRAAKVNDLDVKLIMAMAQGESNFRHDSVSRSGARGIMQIMPKTAALIGLTPDQLFDPKLNILYGSAYFKQHLVRFDSNIGLALSAYAMGSGAVNRGAYSRSYVEKINNLINKIETHLNGTK
jgi:hypothetical protein